MRVAILAHGGTHNLVGTGGMDWTENLIREGEAVLAVHRAREKLAEATRALEALRQELREQRERCK